MHNSAFVIAENGGEIPNRLQAGQKLPLGCLLSLLRPEAGGTGSGVYGSPERT